MKVKVLIADDEKEYTETLATRLELRGFSVTPVFSGQSALDIMEKVDFDAVVLDVNMPEISGLDALKIMKKLKPLTPVIMLTGEGTVNNAIEGMKQGAFDFLLKPADTDLLVQKITEAHDIKEKHDERIRQAEIETILKRRGW
ncbi:MAG: response regulator [Proteobacteria bacterium]|nr:response regulator [Pseudomonadota bacterium]